MADNSTILEKLDGLVARFEEISTLITDPAVIADQKRYVKLTKEYKELDDLMKARKEYMQLLGNIEEARNILANESDADMREMAKEEMDSSQERLPVLEEEIKLMLVPADPQDSKNAILEIRGGAGGDEAAIFAGDLFRMYAKFCETKGWKMEVSSANEGAAGGFKEIICSVTGAMCSRTPSSQSTSAPRRSPMSRMPRSMAGSTSAASMGLNSNTVDRLSTALYT